MCGWDVCGQQAAFGTTGVVASPEHSAMAAPFGHPAVDQPLAHAARLLDPVLVAKGQAVLGVAERVGGQLVPRRSRPLHRCAVGRVAPVGAACREPGGARPAAVGVEGLGGEQRALVDQLPAAGQQAVVDGKAASAWGAAAAGGGGRRQCQRRLERGGLLQLRCAGLREHGDERAAGLARAGQG